MYEVQGLPKRRLSLVLLGDHPGIVRRGKRVDVERVLACDSYWNPPRDSTSNWLYNEVLPSVRAFFEQHAGHEIVFWEDNDVPDDPERLDWMQSGFLPRPSPRYFIEVLGIAKWQQVLDWHEHQEEEQSWYLWIDDAGMEEFHQAFERHLRSKRPPQVDGKAI